MTFRDIAALTRMRSRMSSMRVSSPIGVRKGHRSAGDPVQSFIDCLSQSGHRRTEHIPFSRSRQPSSRSVVRLRRASFRQRCVREAKVTERGTTSVGARSFALSTGAVE